MTKLMMLAASLRKESANKKLLAQAERIARELGIEVDHTDLSEFDAPLYNQDVQDSTGLPKGITHFIKRMKAADGLVIASPEYNFSTPGVLKNLIDWVSRDKPMPWDGQKILLMSASPSLVGGNRGLWATRVPLEACGAFVYPKMLSIPDAYSVFDDSGAFKDPKNSDRLKQNLQSFINSFT